uniref:Protein quiver n=1 Tax=Hydatigena taeniaeformis TaxID=6205 RepID=A0A0R3WHP9_HYDTA
LHPYCRDPFNRTLLHFNEIPYKMCNGYCVKWIRAPLDNADLRHGDLYIRTCSSNLNVRFQISPVCFQESYTVNRRLCFCNRPKCNSALPSNSPLLLMSLLSLLATLLPI